ncbi:MAG: hypothetical protein IPL63_19530 [Saprospiraceae bacterium]|nr:hypothetical protein [Saprospiraceae bacterium]MBK6567095.1 hypothetical protein [Saprospiraceae bacterium]MBK7524777.1 hypothetical protein [Saprospiraceae bacterium]MBK8081483.1 hypothetical protein [Saprospiraceae bacterium]MBK8372557.1 hypothetical protein [Saprospiraceae bacterium]
MYQSSAIESKNNRKGRTISIILHLLLLLIAFLYSMPVVPEEELEEKPPYAVKVDFTFEESSMSKYAHDDAGEKRPQAEEKAEQQPEETKQETTPEPEPTPVEEVKPVDPISTTTTTDDSPIKVVERPKPVIKTPDIIKPVPKKNDDVYTPPVKTEPAPTKSPSTSPSGNSTTKPSSLPGNEGGTGKGDSGTGDGKTKGNDGDEGKGNSSSGSGAYDGSGDGVFGRKVIYRDRQAASNAMTVSGIVTVKICVNRGGIVTYAEVLEAETSIRDRNTRKNFLKAARNYKVKPDYSAPEEQCGKLVFKSDASAVNKLRPK